MRVVALASGSSGNALWVQAGATSVLLDAGLGPRTLAQRLASVGGALHKVTALLLTHEHDDHVRGVSPLVQRYGLPAVGTPGTLRATLGGDGEQCALRPGGELRVGELVVRALAVEHDALEPAAFEVEHDGVRLLVAVDLGSVGQDLLDRGRLADLLVVDCNHDEERLWRGPYPALLKRRIAAPTGHLSNAQAAAFVAACATARRQTVWLAHLSAVNNTPALALAAVRETLAVQGLVAPVLVAARDRVSLRWDSDAPAGEQLGLPDLHGES
ncbi:MAG: MBL fold metallo-hydrolase [Chloroflexi bacterium]|nr:MBL fold metallo-hydrolase [Chloroflexota bacterium]